MRLDCAQVWSAILGQFCKISLHVTKINNKHITKPQRNYFSILLNDIEGSSNKEEPQTFTMMETAILRSAYEKYVL